MIAPKGSLEILEEAWNAYPYCKTVLTNPGKYIICKTSPNQGSCKINFSGYMKGNFFIKVETYHIADRGDSENVHQLTPEQLKMRKVIELVYGCLRFRNIILLQIKRLFVLTLPMTPSLAVTTRPKRTPPSSSLKEAEVRCLGTGPAP